MQPDRLKDTHREVKMRKGIFVKISFLLLWGFWLCMNCSSTEGQAGKFNTIVDAYEMENIIRQ